VLENQTKKKGKLRHPGLIEDAQDLIEEETGLRPDSQTIINGIWKLKVQGRLKDHIWNLTIGRVKCGNYWLNIPDYEQRAYCVACREAEGSVTLETEQHLWLECEHNGQSIAWETAKRIWKMCSTRR